MRPALLRLLHRPSAVSLLSELVSSPSGVQGLNTTCRHCRVHRRHIKTGSANSILRSSILDSNCDRESAPRRALRVHEITPPDDQWQSSTSAGQSRTLDDALPWILDRDRLEFESDVGHLKDIGSRLVDDPARRSDFRLWEELLRYRQRHYSDNGVVDIWEGLTQRGEPVDLPVEGPTADLFWQSFVRVGLQREHFLTDVANYAEDLWKRTGKRWRKFYEAVVGGFFDRGLPTQAVIWHRKLQGAHLENPNDIVRVLDNALSCEPQQASGLSLRTHAKGRTHHGLQAFKDICRFTEGHRIYSVAIRRLVQRDRHLDAVRMHEFLVNRRDPPTSLRDIQPLLQYTSRGYRLFTPRLSDDLKRIRQELLALQEEFSNKAPEAAAEEPAAEPSTPSESKSEGWVEEKPFKDEFGARLFATRAFTVDMIVSGLQMFGVQAIGPLSLREMALRAKGPRDIMEKINALRRAGIAVRDTTFTRLVEKLASENREVLLQDLLESDQHPDVLEDVRLQESFLCSYYLARDWRQYNLTLTILSNICKDSGELHNIHFRKHITAEEWAAASKTVDELHRMGHTLSPQSIEFMLDRVLTPRVHGRGPQLVSRSTPVDEEAFLIRNLQQVARFSSTKINPSLWLELLKRLGMAAHCRWEELRSLCLWLATEHYAVREDSPLLHSVARTRNVPVNKLVTENKAMLRSIFTPQMQMAIVTWGFRMRLRQPHNDDNHSEDGEDGLVPWTRGLLLLRQLLNAGVDISHAHVRRASRQRLAVLFGRPRYSTRRWNRLLRRENRYDVRRVVHDMIAAWDPMLFNGREKYDLVGLVNPASSGMSVRRTGGVRRWVMNMQG
ncbi:hypothetical protein VTN31DRAFT_2244 [Thermomyces dupontii]|uniref:uncharacterized protein n=1 Tax=Talaromyces thermophilus TaxID=28565 RepID=UPI003742CFD0